MQLYPGVNPVALWASFAFAANYGLWPTPDCAVGGDGRDAATLMAAVQSTTDRANLLGQRVALLNPIDGSVGNAAFTNVIQSWNLWRFRGEVDLAGTWFSYGTGTVMGGGVLNVGDVPGGFLGIGHLVVNHDSDITITGTSSHHGTVYVNAFGEIIVGTGGSLSSVTGGQVTLGGATTQTGAYTQSGAGAVQVPRTHVSAAPETIANAAAFDVIICKYASSYIISGGGVAVPAPITLTAPANGTPLGLRLRVTAPLIYTTPLGFANSSMVCEVISAGGGGNGGIVTSVSGGSPKIAGYVDLMVTDIGGGTLAWVAVAQSYSSP